MMMKTMKTMMRMTRMTRIAKMARTNERRTVDCHGCAVVLILLELGY